MAWKRAVCRGFCTISVTDNLHDALNRPRSNPRAEAGCRSDVGLLRRDVRMGPSADVLARCARGNASCPSVGDGTTLDAEERHPRGRDLLHLGWGPSSRRSVVWFVGGRRLATTAVSAGRWPRTLAILRRRLNRSTGKSVLPSSGEAAPSTKLAA